MRFTSDTVKGMIAKLYQADRTTYSSFLVNSPDLERKATNHVRFHTPAHRMQRYVMTFAFPKMRFVTPRDNSMVMEITTPCLVEDNSTDPPTQLLMGRVGDDVTSNSFVLLNAEECKEVVLSLMPDAVASEVGIKKCAGQVGNLTSTVAGAAGPLSLDDIGYNEEQYGRAPVGVVLDKFLAIPPTFETHHGHSLRQPLPDDTDTSNAFPLMRAWANSFRYLYNNTDGHSLHHAATNGNIAPSNFLEGTDTAPDGTFSEDMKDFDTFLSSTCFLDLTFIDSEHRLVRENINEINAAIQRSLETEVASLPVVDNNSASNPVSNEGGAGWVAGMKTTLDNLNSTMKTSSEGSKNTEKKKKQDDKELLYRMLFCGKTTDANGVSIIELGNCSDSFKEVIRTTNEADATAMTQEGIEAMKFDEMSKETPLGLQADLNIRVFNAPAVTCLRNCHWHSKPLDHCVALLDQALSVLQFLPCSPTNSAFKKLVESTRRHYYDNLYDERDSTRAGTLLLPRMTVDFVDDSRSKSSSLNQLHIISETCSLFPGVFIPRPFRMDFADAYRKIPHIK